MFFLLQGWQAMSSFLVAAMMITYAVGPLSLICLRKQLPDHKRPFRLRYSGLISFIGFYICTAGVYWTGLDSLLKLFVLISLGLGLYLFNYFVFKKSRHELDIKNALWLLGYIAGLGIFSYYGNYGGIKLLSPYWDLLYLLGFAFVIFNLAVFSRKAETYTEMITANEIV